MTESATAPAKATREAFIPRKFWIAVIAAALINVVIFFVITGLGASLVVGADSPMAVTTVPVVIATVVPLLLAGLVTFLLARKWPVLRTVAAWAGLVFAAASTFAPLTGAADVATGIGLAAMHLVAGASWFFGVKRRDATSAG